MTTERNMSPKGFLHKAKGKVSPLAFLAAHRDWLTTGQLAEVTSPILAKIDSGEMMPTVGFIAVQEAVLSHHLATEIRKGEETMAKAQEPTAPKNYMATIFDKDGNIPEEWREKEDTETGAITGEWVPLQQSFELPQRAHGWTDRKLAGITSGVDWRGEVASTKMSGADGLPMTEHVTREDAFARVLHKAKGPVVHTRGVSTKALSFGVKAKQTRNVRANMG